MFLHHNIPQMKDSHTVTEKRLNVVVLVVGTGIWCKRTTNPNSSYTTSTAYSWSSRQQKLTTFFVKRNALLV